MIICLEMIRLSYIYKIRGESVILYYCVIIQIASHTLKSSFQDAGKCSSNLQLSYKIQSHPWKWENTTLPYPNSFFSLHFSTLQGSPGIIWKYSAPKSSPRVVQLSLSAKKELCFAFFSRRKTKLAVFGQCWTQQRSP